MLSTTMLSSFANQGQICFSGSRIFVEHFYLKNLKLISLLKQKINYLVAPMEDKTKIGAVVS